VWWPSRFALDCDVGAVYGERIGQGVTGAPTSAFVAEGSSISIYRGDLLPA
jgi:hypothetical protein